MADDYWKEPPYVPCHGDLFGLGVALVPRRPDEEFAVLDIGSGSGAFAAQIARAFSKARLTLLEPDEKLLRKSLSRLGPDAARADAVVLDWTVEDPPGSHDVVSIVLSTHALDAEERGELYEAAFGALRRNGLLLLIERVKAGTPAVDQAYRSAWQQQVLAGGGDAALAAQHLADLKPDGLGTVADELAAVSSAGFVEVNCWYQNLSYALITGVRPI
ncbi:MAG: class I SAM-dependent methyltransferase [Reyranellaceae bacterium]